MRAWQLFLRDAEHIEVPITGKFDLATEKATIKFQKKYWLKQTGVVDKRTYYRADRLDFDPISPTGIYSPPVASKNYGKQTTGTRRVTQARMPGQSLRALIGTLGASNTGGEEVNVHYARLSTQAYITRLEASKEANKGVLNVRFYFPGYPNPEKGWAPTIPSRFLVRLFDANGNYLSHFVSTQMPLIPLGQTPNPGYGVGYRNLKFSVNLVDLRETRIVEFGFAVASKAQFT